MRRAALLLFPALAFAQPAPPACWPAEIGGSAVDAGFGATGNGAYLWWQCPDGSVSYLVRDLTLTNSALGGRLDTIMSKDDKEAAALASWRRNVTLPGSDPRFAAICADLRNSLQARGIKVKVC